MDLHMPRLDGVDTTKYLRENGYTCPIVAVTANNLKSEKVRGYDAGITDFIIKPVSVSNISTFSDYHAEIILFLISDFLASNTFDLLRAAKCVSIDVHIKRLVDDIHDRNRD